MGFQRAQLYTELAMQASPPAPASRPKESMLASATYDSTPRVGLVLSSFKEGMEHDGTALPGLAQPAATDQPLTPAQMSALLTRAQELAMRGNPRRGGRGGPGSEDWIVFLVTRTEQIATDPLLLSRLLDQYATQKRGKRFTVAASGAPPSGYEAMLGELAKRYPTILFQYADLAREPYLQVPATRRTFAAKNPNSEYAIPKVIRECDRLISVAPLQTSPLTGVSLTIGNYWALAPESVYGARHEKLFAMGDPVDLLTDLYLHHPADYAILGGPVHRDASGEIRHNIVIAGTNALSVDAIGAAVMGFDALKLPLLDKLELRGFGVRDPDLIWTRGNELDEARKPFRKPQGWEKS